MDGPVMAPAACYAIVPVLTTRQRHMPSAETLRQIHRQERAARLIKHDRRVRRWLAGLVQERVGLDLFALVHGDPHFAKRYL